MRQHASCSANTLKTRRVRDKKMRPEELLKKNVFPLAFGSGFFIFNVYSNYFYDYHTHA